ncbi:MAG: hypothetical protein HQK54_14125 [Oligoflexales bacterium]|nr:hypothetical protein [Oligoflexales bacterium]
MHTRKMISALSLTLLFSSCRVVSKKLPDPVITPESSLAAKLSENRLTVINKAFTLLVKVTRPTTSDFNLLETSGDDISEGNGFSDTAEMAGGVGVGKTVVNDDSHYQHTIESTWSIKTGKNSAKILFLIEGILNKDKSSSKKTLDTKATVKVMDNNNSEKGAFKLFYETKDSSGSEDQFELAFDLKELQNLHNTIKNNTDDKSQVKLGGTLVIKTDPKTLNIKSPDGISWASNDRLIELNPLGIEFDKANSSLSDIKIGGKVTNSKDEKTLGSIVAKYETDETSKTKKYSFKVVYANH